MSEPVTEETIFAAVLRVPLDQRGLYLDQAVGREGALRQRVEALLSAHARSGGFLEQPIVPPPPRSSSLVPVPLAEKPGDLLGRYKLLQHIGEGGCGVVYMAEQQQPVQRRVALKIIKLGMDTRQVIARFEAERQALALMDHPNIAKVLDAGATETGRPFFVMELVRGTKITDFCDKHNLNTRERLDLFLQVCRAVQHAHQKGIIHRDLKPSNLLVTLHDGVPVPKVIDFGIAKATQGRLTDKTVFTAFEQFIGTPAYMSPEQTEMSGLDIDTRSDIYSLGVLLYELLTGKTPFDSKELLAAGLEVMRRTIREQEPARPSTRLSTMGAGELTTTARCRRTDSPRLVHTIRGDLDWIVMKCLEKDRARRYETANGLAADLQRHLNQEPVLACPPSRLYRFRKLVRRNKPVVVAVSAVAVALVMGFGLSTWLYLQERAAKREQTRLRFQAEANEKKAQAAALKDKQVAGFLEDMLQGIGPSVALGRDTRLLREVLDKATKRVGEDLKNQPEVHADMLTTLGNVYYDLGDYQQAEAMDREALALRKRLWGNGHTDAEVGEALNSLAVALEKKGKLAEAEDTHREALAIRRKLWGEESELAANSLINLGEVLHARGKLPKAESSDREAMRILLKHFGSDNAAVAAVVHNLSGVLCDEGNLAEAETLTRQALEMRRRLFGNEHPDVTSSLHELASVLDSQGKFAEAEELERQVVAAARKFWGTEHEYVAASLGNLAGMLREQGKYAEGDALETEALAMRRKLWGNEHSDIAYSLNNLGMSRRDQGKLAEAEPLLREALAMRKKLLGSDHPEVAHSLDNLASLLERQGRLDEAESLCREALAINRKAFTNQPGKWEGNLGSLANICLDRHKEAEMEQIFQDLLTPAMQNQPQGASLFRTRAGFLARCARWKEAAADAEEANALEPNTKNIDHTLILLRVANDDRDGYRRSCQVALARFTATNEPILTARMSLDCLVLSPCGVDLAVAGKMADSALRLGTNNYFLPQFELCKALAEYRLGHSGDAAEWAAQPLASSGYPWDEFLHVEAESIIAMSRFQLKRFEEARAALAETARLAETKFPRPEMQDLGRNWQDWVVAQALFREASQLIQSK